MILNILTFHRVILNIVKIMLIYLKKILMIFTQEINQFSMIFNRLGSDNYLL